MQYSVKMDCSSALSQSFLCYCCCSVGWLFFLFILYGNMNATTMMWYCTGETQAHRDVLYELYRTTNGTEWKTNCQAGGWTNMSTYGVPNTTMCNKASGSYSLYYGLTCTGQDGRKDVAALSDYPIHVVECH